MAAKRHKTKLGDVFRIPLSENESGFGQIIADDSEGILLMVIFDHRTRNCDSPELTDIVASEPLFISDSVDAKIWHGDWPIVGNMPPDLERFPLPNYRVDINGVTYVESYYGDRIRPATAAEFTKLSPRGSRAPIRLENALKAYYGFIEWDDSFDELTADVAFRSATIDV